MALGRACVAADCPSGPRELLAPDTPVDSVASGVETTASGILVPPMPPDDLPAHAPLTTGEQALSDTLIRLLQQRDLRRHLGAAAGARAGAFTPARAFADWQRLIAGCLERAG
jgi:glycosyltransferase involved in cell wall biosynthesis